MTIYIALLRGINVGGKNIVKMADLKRVFEAIGLREVRTYIQSGNVLFKSDKEEKALRNKIEHEIEANFGYSVTIVLRTASELEQVFLNCPFSADEIAEAESASGLESLYVALLSSSPSQDDIVAFNACKSQNEEYKILGREVFLLFRKSIRNSKLANNLQKLDISVTVRNWKTIGKLTQLVKEMRV